MQILRITPKESTAKNKKGHEVKTRAFSVTLLGAAFADHMWEGGQTQTKNLRPVLLTFAGLPTEINPFLANIRGGKTADVLSAEHANSYSRGPDNRIEIPKSAGFIAIKQELADGNVIATLYLRSLFSLEASMVDPQLCSFIAAPSQSWVEAQSTTLTNEQRQNVLAWAADYGLMSGDNKLKITLVPDQIVRLAVVASYVVAHLDRRTRMPILNDMAFWTQVYVAGLIKGVWLRAATNESLKIGGGYHRTSEDQIDRMQALDPWLRARPVGSREAPGLTTLSINEPDLAEIGYEALVACHVEHSTLDTFLAEQTQLFIQGGVR